MREDQIRVGVVEDSGFNFEVELADFANGMDVGTEWQTGFKDAGLATAGLHLLFPEMGKSWVESNGGAGFGKSQR